MPFQYSVHKKTILVTSSLDFVCTECKISLREQTFLQGRDVLYIGKDQLIVLTTVVS